MADQLPRTALQAEATALSRFRELSMDAEQHARIDEIRRSMLAGHNTSSFSFNTDPLQQQHRGRVLDDDSLNGPSFVSVASHAAPAPISGAGYVSRSRTGPSSSARSLPGAAPLAPAASSARSNAAAPVPPTGRVDSVGERYRSANRSAAEAIRAVIRDGPAVKAQASSQAAPQPQSAQQPRRAVQPLSATGSPQDSRRGSVESVERPALSQQRPQRDRNAAHSSSMTNAASAPAPIGLADAALSSHMRIAASQDVASLRAEVSSIMLQLSEQKQRFLSVVADLEGQLQAALKARAAAEVATEIAEAQAEKEAAAAAKAAATLEATMDTMQVLTASQHTLQAAHAGCATAIATAEARSSALLQERDAARAEQQAAVAQAAAADRNRLEAEAASSAAAAEVAEIHRELESVRSQRDAVRAAAESRCAAAVEAAEAKLQAAAEEIALLQQRIAAREATVVSITERWESARHAAEAAAAREAGQSERAAAAVGLADARAVQLEAAQARIGSLESEVASLQLQLQAAHQSLDDERASRAAAESSWLTERQRLLATGHRDTQSGSAHSTGFVASSPSASELADVSGVDRSRAVPTADTAQSVLHQSLQLQLQSQSGLLQLPAAVASLASAASALAGLIANTSATSTTSGHGSPLLSLSLQQQQQQQQQQQPGRAPSPAVGAGETFVGGAAVAATAASAPVSSRGRTLQPAHGQRQHQQSDIDVSSVRSAPHSRASSRESRSSSRTAGSGNGGRWFTPDRSHVYGDAAETEPPAVSDNHSARAMAGHSSPGAPPAPATHRPIRHEQLDSSGLSATSGSSSGNRPTPRPAASPAAAHTPSSSTAAAVPSPSPSQRSPVAAARGSQRVWSEPTARPGPAAVRLDQPLPVAASSGGGVGGSTSGSRQQHPSSSDSLPSASSPVLVRPVPTQVRIVRGPVPTANRSSTEGFGAPAGRGGAHNTGVATAASASASDRSSPGTSAARAVAAASAAQAAAAAAAAAERASPIGWTQVSETSMVSPPGPGAHVRRF